MIGLGLWLTFFGGLVAMNTTQADAYALPKMVALGLGLALIWAGTRAARRTVLDGPVLSLWIVAIASTWGSGDWPTAVFGIYGQPYHGLLAMAFCTLALYAGASGGKEMFERAMVPLSAALLVMSAFAFAQAAGFVPAPWAMIGGRVISTTGSPVLLGGVLCVALPYLLHRSGKGPRWVFTAAMVATVMTVSRGSMLAAACGVVVYFVMMRQVSVRRAVAAVVIVAAVVAGGTMLRGSRAKSDAFRIEGVKIAALAVMKAPLLGYGPDCYLNALRENRDAGYVKAIGGNLLMSAKGDVLQVAVTLGLLGLAAYLWLIFCVVGRVRDLYGVSEFFSNVIGSPDYRISAAVAGSVAAAFVHTKWNQLPIEALVLTAFAAGVLCQREEEVPSPRRAIAFRIGAFVVAAVAVNLCAANIALTKGIAAWEQRDFPRAANMMRMAVNLAPWEIENVAKRCEEIYLLAKWVQPYEAKDFMQRALRASVQMVERSPSNASAWELLASSCWQAAPHLGVHLLRDAHRAIVRAQELDPLSEFTAERKRMIEADMARVGLLP